MMNLPMYQSMLNVRDTKPYDYYKNLQQSLIDYQWDNTTTLYTVLEQYLDFSWNFHEIETHINHAIAMVTSGTKNGDDFRKLSFRDLDHTINRGLYYQFDNNYWLTTFTDEHNRLIKDIMVRRCNNWLKWIDPKTNELIKYPCVVSYDAGSPQNQIDNDIITPNNSLNIIIQGNENTRMIYTNQRFILGKRPFKIAGYNNTLMDFSSDDLPNILYFDVYLDEISPYDDLENDIANNFDPINNIGIEEGKQEIPTNESYIKISPFIDSLNQEKSVIIQSQLISEDGESLEEKIICEPSGANPSNYVLEDIGNNQFRLTNTHFDSVPLMLKFKSGNISSQMVIQLKPLF